MGNCVKPASSMEWDGQDWSDLKSKKSSSSKEFGKGHHELSLGKGQKEKLMQTLRVSPDASGKVKIRISKKELAELFDKQQQQRASAEQVLLRLIKARNDDAGHRLWMPMLESIPEAT
ncbi:hypothetical protein LR48_Vigan01g337100 [Vigna angularis]|uniref:Uncharacterized protein n=2 Tax=Phaseolus angularis TaxID=3914 RepID=A0A0L9TTE8_PHAAN|nr:uncharacterized protein LOC108341912 [Vigna angularis]KOM33815.1 hypothetical protein LR48_Vigan01g337100 [Vigna angularis]BAT77386.1 hypothetical protein VIGAN_01549700 [Vigna angularis var. angularis]